MDRGELIKIIKQTTLFSGLSLENIDKILPHFVPVHLTQGKILFTQGDVSRDLFVLVSGKLVSLLEASSQSQEKIIGNIYPSETVGELGVISGEPRSLTVKALEESVLLRLSGAYFLELIQTIPTMAIDILKLITRRSQKTLALFSEATQTRFIVLIPANPAVPLEKFRNNLLKYSREANCEVTTMNSDNEKILLELKHKFSHHKTTQILFVEQVTSLLLGFLEDYPAHVYLLVNGEDEPELALPVKQLLDKTIESHTLKSWKMIVLHKNNIRRPFGTKKWLDAVNVDLHHHVGINVTEHYLRLLRFFTGKAVGIVLSSGALRGFIHLGVIKAMLRKKIPIDFICGTSIGGAVGGMYAFAAGNYKRTLKMCTLAAPTIRSSVLFKQFVWPLVSLFSDRSLTKLTMDVFGDVNIEDLWLPFFCVSSNLSLNVEKVHRTGPLWQAVRCTTSIPGIYPPVEINGQLYCDGALLNDIPADILRAILGNDGKILVSIVSASNIDLNPYLIPLFLSFKDTLFYKLGIRKNIKFPRFFDTFFHALLLGSSAKSIQNCFFGDVIIKPDVSHLPLFNISDKQLQELITYGYEETIKVIDKGIF